MQPAPLAGTATNRHERLLASGTAMQPAPLAGTATENRRERDGHDALGCNPPPSRGQQLNGVLVELLVVQMQPAPLRRLWKKRQEAMASCLFFPSWLSPTAGPTAT